MSKMAISSTAPQRGMLTSSPDMARLLGKIAPAVWEEKLDIGQFKRLQIQRTECLPYSVVARATVFGDRGTVDIHAKVYLNARQEPAEVLRDKVLRDYAALEFWWWQFQDSRHYRVVQPVCCLPDSLLIVTRSASGVPLLELILSGRHRRREALSGCRRAGEWLQFFLRKVPDEPESYSIEHLQAYLEVRLQKLVQDPRRGFPVALAKEIRRFLQAHQGRLSPVERRLHLSHSDYHPGNILIENEVVTVLDFGRRVPESFLLDVSRMYHQLALFGYKPGFSRRYVRQLQEALLEGFGQPEVEELPLFQLQLIRHLVNHLATITKYWQQSARERLYNRWVAYREIQWLKTIVLS